MTPTAASHKLAVLLAFAIVGPGIAQETNDPILRAMLDELARSRELRVVSPDPPYYISYRVEDGTVLALEATLGALVSSNQLTDRVPTVQVRVGDSKFDNTGHVYSDYDIGSRFDPEQLPVENDYQAFRRAFWLATDRAYKTAEEALGRKRSTLKNVNLPEQLPDFSPVQPAHDIQAVKRTPVNEAFWKDRVVKLSAIFADYPAVLSSDVELQAVQSTDYLATSEGAAIRYPEDLAFIRVRASAQATGGAPVRDAAVFQAFDLNGLPVEAELRKGIADVARNVSALTAAPQGESYDGPVLFEARAAAQLFGQLLGDNLKITRKPLADPGRPLPYLPSELENRLGSRVLPEWMDVVDDPTQTEWRGHTLFGHYEYDLEGVSPKPLALIEKGALKTFLLTRTPALKGFETTNGRARMPGSFGAEAPGFGNLFIRASQTEPAASLKAKLIELCKQRNKPFGILVRKLDYPSSAGYEELRRVMAAMAQSGGGSRPVSLPLLVYRVYPDGREELVRGLRFRGLSTRSFKDIIAASDESYVFDFIDSPAPFAMMGAGGFITSASVIAPAVLFDELELEPIQEEAPKLPIVPAPPLVGGAP
jgi:hypothetical protein